MEREDLAALPMEDLLARAIYGEARGEGEPGMLAVAHVILNRAAHPGWWGRTPTEVILKPWQFSCFNQNDPNLPLILDLDFDAPEPQFVPCIEVAEAVLAGSTSDPTLGATAYYAPGPKQRTPAWATPANFAVKIGHQLFYRVPV